MRKLEMLSGAMAVRIRYVGHDDRWEGDLSFDPTDDSRELLRMLTRMIDAPGRKARVLPGPARATPLSVSVTLHRLVERRQSTGSLFESPATTRKVDAVIDRINAKFGYNKVYFGSMQAAIDHDAAPMRIPFNRIPDSASENESRKDDAQHHALWLQSLNRAKVLAEHAHRQEREGKAGDLPPKRE